MNIDIVSNLSVREMEVFELLLFGHNNKQISKLIGIQPATVKFHCSNIYFKLGASGRVELMFRYSRYISE